MDINELKLELIQKVLDIHDEKLLLKIIASLSDKKDN